MTAQSQYLSSILVSFSTFLESSSLSAHERDEAQTLFVSFLTQKKDFATWTVQELARFLRNSKSPTPSAEVEARLIAFVEKYPPHQTSVFLHEYLLALKAEHCSASTIKNYRSDINQFLDFVQESEISRAVTKPNVKVFIAEQAKKGLKTSSIRRKLVSIVQFALWLQRTSVLSSLDGIDSLGENLESLTTSKPPRKYQIPEQKIQLSPVPTPQGNVLSQTLIPAGHHISALKSQDLRARMKSGLSALSTKVFANRSKPAALPIVNLAIILVFALALGVFGYRQFILDTKAPLAYPTSPTRPNRVLQFQGRLTDTSQNPIITATDMAFRLYDSNSGGSLLWNSGTCSVTPDQDGIFNADLGSTCGTEISQDVFTENSNVWLEVEIESETLTPRQSIKTVPYALNSETLQGYPIEATGAAINNTVVTMNNLGEVVFGEVSPTLRAVSGTFAIEAETLSLQTSSGSNGDIILAPDGTGLVQVQSDLDVRPMQEAPHWLHEADLVGLRIFRNGKIVRELH